MTPSSIFPKIEFWIPHHFLPFLTKVGTLLLPKDKAAKQPYEKNDKLLPRNESKSCSKCGIASPPWLEGGRQEAVESRSKEALNAFILLTHCFILDKIWTLFLRWSQIESNEFWIDSYEIFRITTFSNQSNCKFSNWIQFMKIWLHPIVGVKSNQSN